MFKAVQNLREQKAFTLIELLIVVAIIGILAAIAIPAYIGAQEKARKSTQVKAAASAESDLQHWMNSAVKGSIPNSPGASLIEVDTDWNGTITTGDMTNSTLYLISGTSASDAVVTTYSTARFAELSPWAAFAGCASTSRLFLALANTVDPGGDNPATCQISLYGGTTGSNITLVAMSNGPGGNTALSKEVLHRKVVGYE